MEQQLDRPGIYVTIGKQKYAYYRLIQSDSSINYIPDKEKPAVFDKTFVNEYLFLPIDTETFKRDKTNKYYGFRYIFSSTQNETYVLGPTQNGLNVTHAQIELHVHRIRYKMDGNNGIVVDKQCDDLYPPQLFELSGPTSHVGKMVMDHERDTVELLNDFYLNREV